MKLIIEINGRKRSLNRIVATVVLMASMLVFLGGMFDGFDREYEMKQAEIHMFLQGTKMDPNPATRCYMDH